MTASRWGLSACIQNKQPIKHIHVYICIYKPEFREAVHGVGQRARGHAGEEEGEAGGQGLYTYMYMYMCMYVVVFVFVRRMVGHIIVSIYVCMRTWKRSSFSRARRTCGVGRRTRASLILSLCCVSADERKEYTHRSMVT